MILVGVVHGRVEVIKMIEGVPHFPEMAKKGRVKWQATIVCPNRIKTFEEKDITDEEAMKLCGTKE